MSFIKFEWQSLKWICFGIYADLDCYLHQISCFGLRSSLVKLSLVFLYLILLTLYPHFNLVINRKFVYVIRKCVRNYMTLMVRTYTFRLSCQHWGQSKWIRDFQLVML